MSPVCSHRMFSLPKHSCVGLHLKIGEQKHIFLKTHRDRGSHKMSNLSQRYAWFEFDTEVLLNLHTTGTSNNCTHWNTSIKNAGLRRLCHITVGTGARWDICLFSAVNRSREVTGAWLGVGGPGSVIDYVSVWVCVCGAVIYLCIPLLRYSVALSLFVIHSFTHIKYTGTRSVPPHTCALTHTLAQNLKWRMCIERSLEVS